MEIEYYSVAYFHCFSVQSKCSAGLLLKMGLVHAVLIEALHSSSTFNGSSALQHFKCGNAIITFLDFYLGSTAHISFTLVLRYSTSNGGNEHFLISTWVPQCISASP